MEIIKKQIYLNPYVSRHASLIPYIVKDKELQKPLIMGYSFINTESFALDGNWGKYPYDIDLNRCEKFLAFDGRTIIEPQKLKRYFSSTRVSFSELSYRFREISNVINDTNFYVSILKNSQQIWVLKEISLNDKLSTQILSSFPENPRLGDYCGIRNDNLYNENGGKEMYLFLLRAMGMFIVDSSYIKEDNGVPEIMYFLGIKNYLERMKKGKDSDICCSKNDFYFWGGNAFYNYLNTKWNEIDDEILYWFNGLYRDIIIPPPNIYMPIAINEETHNIGNYTPLTEYAYADDDISTQIYRLRYLHDISYLDVLKTSKTTYCDRYDYEKDAWVSDVLPFNLKESDDGKTYELTELYITNHPVNIKEENSNIYGDMIYRIEYDYENYEAHFYYVIGGKLKLLNNKWVYNEAIGGGIINIEDFIKNPKSYTNEVQSIDGYMYLRSELETFLNNNVDEKIVFKGDLVGEYYDYPINIDETWVYRVNFRKEKYNIGDFIIVYYDNEESTWVSYLILLSNVNDYFSGIRYYEKRKFTKEDLTQKTNMKIDMLFDDKKVPVNILNDETIIKNIKDTKVIGECENEYIEGFFITEEDNLSDGALIMNDYDLGKVEMLIDNPQDLLLDRGYVSTFELHYKLSEINTMEDMENYGNNFFGL